MTWGFFLIEGDTLSWTCGLCSPFETSWTVMISEKVVESLNFQLDDLACEGTERFQASDLDSDQISGSFMVTCNALLKNLAVHDKNIGPLPCSNPFEVS